MDDASPSVTFMDSKSPAEERAKKIAIQSIAYQGDRVLDAIYALVIGAAMGFTLGFMVSALLT